LTGGSASYRTAAGGQRDAMTDFLLGNTPIFLFLLASAVMIYTARNWSSLPVLRRLTALQFLFVTMHILEELRFGGFVELVQKKLHFTLENPHFGELVLGVIVLIIFLPPLLFPRVAFLAMVPMLLGVMELLAHTVAAFTMSDTRIPYSPGLVSAVVLLFPVSVYGILYAIKNNLMRPKDWLFSFLVMIAGLMAAQMIVVRSTGMPYPEFLRNVRRAIFGG
jgi:hypothetical protein